MIVELWERVSNTYEKKVDINFWFTKEIASAHVGAAAAAEAAAAAVAAAAAMVVAAAVLPLPWGQ